jgi:hypothetical protein
MLQAKEEERLGLHRLIARPSRVARRHLRIMMASWLSIGAGLKPEHPDNVAVDCDTCTERCRRIDGAGRGRSRAGDGHNIDIL